MQFFLTVILRFVILFLFTGLNFQLSFAQNLICPDTCNTPGIELVTNGDFNLAIPNQPYSIIPPCNPPAWSSAGPLFYGEYFVTDDASNHNPQWSGFDHTTANGNFLICDGLIGQQTAAWGQSVNISAYPPNTDFVFSAWVNNIVWPIGNYSDPALQLRIAGTLMLTSSVLLPELPDNWIKLTATWNSGPTPPAAVTLEVVSTTTDALGNDYGIDDISFRACIPSTSINVDAGNDTTICAGENVQLNAIANSGTFIWTPSVGLNLNNIPNPVATPLITTTYIVTAGNGSTCTDSDTITVVVNNLSIADFTYTSQPCSHSINFQNQSINAIQYGWNFGDGGTSLLQNPVHTYNGPGIYPVTLIAFGACGNDTILQQVEVDSSGLPVADFNYSLATCSDTIYTINNSSNSTNFTWNFGTGNSTNLNQPSHIYNTAGNYVIALVAENTCGSDTAYLPVTIPDYTIEASFTGTQDSCDYEVLFTNTSLNATNCSWDFGDGLSDTIQAPQHTYLTPGIYEVMLVVYNFCNTDSFLTDINVLPVEITRPSMIIDIDSCDLTFSYFNTTINSYDQRWDFGDGTFSELKNGIHSFRENENINLTLTINEFSGCRASMDTTIIINDLFDAFYIPNAFTPNGDGKNETFDIINNLNCNASSLAIYNRWGNLVFEDESFPLSWDGSMDGKPVPEDVYFYVLASGKRNFKGTVLVLY